MGRRKGLCTATRNRRPRVKPAGWHVESFNRAKICRFWDRFRGAGVQESSPEGAFGTWSL